MKRFLIITGGVCLLSAAAVAAEQSMLARVTVYWASGGGGSDHWTRKHVAASGARLRSGHCAVDPRRIPYGSKVRVDGDTLVAVDTGGHVKSRRAALRAGRTAAERNAIVIDRFFETKGQALAWAKHHPHFMTVTVDSSKEPSATARSLVATATQKTQPTVTTAAATVVSIAPPARKTSALRNSISTPRTQSVAVVRTNLTRTQNAPLIAANKTTPAVEAATEPVPRSRLGRSLAYIP
ncbi:MAG: hypothetical protein ACJ8HU_01685 [Chthoniobacterales bacterium]